MKNFWGNFDLSISCMVIGQGTRISKLEKVLHFIFDNWKIELEEAIDGYTEWFNIACFEDVKKEIKRISHFRSHLPLKLIEGIEVPQKISKQPNKWQSLSREEKRTLRENRIRERKTQILNENQEKFHCFVELLHTIEPSVIGYRKHPEYKKHWQLMLKNPGGAEVAVLMRSCSFHIFNGGCNVITETYTFDDNLYFVNISESSIEFLKSHEETQEIGRAITDILEKIKSTLTRCDAPRCNDIGKLPPPVKSKGVEDS